MFNPSTLLILLSFILSLHHFCHAESDCKPSACGIIPNIRPPFRLKGSPKHCGDRRFELTCENNVTSLYLNSHKFYVKAINYSTANSTIRLVDASINTTDICSFPNSSAYHYNFTYPYPQGYPYQIILDRPENLVINLMSCPYPLDKSNSTFTDFTHCATSTSTSTSSSSDPTFYYIKVGPMKAMCTVEAKAMTAWMRLKDLKNVSLQEIHHSLLYGFELYVCPQCAPDPTYWDGLFLVFLFILGLLCLTIFPLVIMVGLAVVVGIALFHYHILPHIFILIAFVPRVFLWFLAMAFLIHKFRKRHQSANEAIESFLQGDDNNLLPIRYSYQNIRKITRNFKDKIGEGGYGHVYKGKLRSGHHVAVKMLAKSGANAQDFINEIATIGRIHHVNVVKLFGYCVQGSKRALVYDFMPNGSLDKYILKSAKKANSLSWNLKFEIAVGVARGIEYLHRGCDIQILHFDIKPHNILLDDKFIPKIADFGLAKFCSPDKTAVTMTCARGTIGYVAPELISRSIGEVSFKADVYSFGMMLMDMVGLKRDLADNGDSNMCFPYWIYDYVNNDKDIDVGIADENDGTKALVRKMAIVALWCIQMSPSDRPSMNKVLEMLEGNVESLQAPTCPSQSSQNVLNMDEGGSLTSADSLPLLSCVSSSVEITVAKC